MKSQSSNQEAIIGAITIIVIAASIYFESWWPLVGTFLLCIVAIVWFAVGYQRVVKRREREND
jgi:hypothetical protein